MLHQDGRYGPHRSEWREPWTVQGLPGSWTDDNNAATVAVATVTERGEIGFGASLSGSAQDSFRQIDELNLIGSLEKQAFDGAGINQFGPNYFPAFIV